MTRVGLTKIVGRLGLGTADGAPDGELLERFVSHRDEAAFAELVARHGSRVFAVCCRVLGHHHLAEDAFQATFLVLARRASSVRPRSAVGGFLYGVARRAALEAFAVSRRRKETLVGAVPEPPATEPPAVEPDVLALLDEEIANLSEPLRAAVVMCELDGVSRADAARQLGIAEGTLSSRLAAARKQLAERLKKRGVALSASLLVALADSARAAVPPVLQTGSASAVAIAGGVLKAMMLAKLRTAAALGVLLTALAAWALVPSAAPRVAAAPRAAAPVPEPAAAPVPKPAADPGVDPGVIWVYYPTKAGKIPTLTAYTPDGKRVEEVTLRDADRFLGLTPDGRKLAFMGKGGKLAESPRVAGLTVHLRDIGDGAEGTDTGVPTGEGYAPPVWSPDMKRAAYSRITKDGVQPSFKYAVVDLATKKETPLDLPADHAVVRWSPDGSWLLVYQRRSVSNQSEAYLRYTLATGNLETITDKRFYYNMDLSPDGKTLIGFAEPREPLDRTRRGPLELGRFDVATGAVTKADKFAQKPDDMFVMSRWSLDGKRVAHAVRERGAAKDKESFRVVVCDPDGGNEVKLMASPGQFTGWIYWLPTRPKAVPAPK